MNRRKSLIAAAGCAALMIALLMPLAFLLSAGQGDAGANDADHMIRPMLDLLETSAQRTADTPVGGMMDIEEAWAIEDTREERSETPLVTAMRRGDSELAFDAASNTFYCTLGMEGGEEWPEMPLFAAAAGADNLSVAWIDDYTYDYRSDAVREGYRYELIAYTDTEYAYFGVVFTGLPTVTLHVSGGSEALSEAYIPARMTVSAEGYEAINSGIWIHTRGGGYEKARPKWSFRVEFHEYTDRGDKKTARSVLGMPADTDWLLLANASDESCARNQLAWDLWHDWNEGKAAFMLLDYRPVEVFLDDEYMGVYQLMQRIDEEAEIARMGGDPQTDYAARILNPMNLGEKPNADWTELAGLYGELRHAPQGVSAKTAFRRFDPLIDMSAKSRSHLTDEEFIALCEKHVDIRAMVEYFLFVQAASLGMDNYYNNVYMWALRKGGSHVYYLSPWDMDMAFTRIFGNGDQDTINLHYALAWRMIDLDVGGAKRMLWEIWNARRRDVISDDAMYQRFLDYEEMINASGAYLRESEKWYGGAQPLSLSEMQAFAVEHLHVADRMLSQLFPHTGAILQE